MLTQTLNGKWNMKELGEEQWIEASVPGSVMSALLTNKKTEDPFWRVNEYGARDLFRKDYEYQRSFQIDDALYSQDKIELVCYGLDTLSEIYVNDKLLAKTNNMHRTWRIDCKSLLMVGENRIRIIFRSPIQYIETYKPAEGKEIYHSPTNSIYGGQFLRKAHCMFGWDWGAQVPDAGIWRDVELVAFSDARIEDVEIVQKHEFGKVELNINTELEVVKKENYSVEVTLLDTEAQRIIYQKDHKLEGNGKMVSHSIVVEQPKLWWPNNYGKQPLYQVRVVLRNENFEIHYKEMKIGLRTITVSQEKDQWGSEFALQVNGVKIFTKGANYIPEDTVYANITKDRIEYLIKSSVRANFNCLRVWGGGYYPSDEFYDLCDQYGIIVWQDLMYACNVYELTKEFADNIIEETKDNVRRLRHHASLGLWCGNNEIESAWYGWTTFQPHSPYLRADYIKQFEYILPETVKAIDDTTFYWPSSPSSGGCFDNPDDENRGDVHYWEVWHGSKSFQDYRNHYFRFCSEFGFQSFPVYKTVKTYTEEEDRNIFSAVMESHQKNIAANGRIMLNMAQNFLYPKDFEHLLYVSQIMQGIAIKFGVEHWRRNRGRCMGSLYWQLNDSWPVASWSSIDYYGRWKALHYMVKNFYAPIAGSIHRNNLVVETHIQNEELKEKQCHIQISLKTMDFTVIHEETHEITIPALSARMVTKKDYYDLVKGKEEKVFVEAIFTYEDGQSSTEVEIFVPFKHLQLQKPKIAYEVTEDEEKFNIHLMSDHLACFVELDFEERDAIFSDNYFYLSGNNTKVIELLKVDIQGEQIKDASDLRSKLKVRSLRDSYTL